MLGTVRDGKVTLSSRQEVSFSNLAAPSPRLDATARNVAPFHRRRSSGWQLQRHEEEVRTCALRLPDQDQLTNKELRGHKLDTWAAEWIFRGSTFAPPGGGMSGPRRDADSPLRPPVLAKAGARKNAPQA